MIAIILILSGNEDTNDNDPKEWSQKDAGLLGTKIPECVPKKLSNVDQNLLENCSTAVDYYEVFLGQQYTEEIVKQSKLYAVHTSGIQQSHCEHFRKG